jgi:hypothetical protein
LLALKAVAKDDAHAADNRRWGMSNRCCSYIKLGFSAVLLAAAMTLQNATPVHAAIKAMVLRVSRPANVRQLGLATLKRVTSR